MKTVLQYTNNKNKEIFIIFSSGTKARNFFYFDCPDNEGHTIPQFEGLTEWKADIKCDLKIARKWDDTNVIKMLEAAKKGIKEAEIDFAIDDIFAEVQ